MKESPRKGFMKSIVSSVRTVLFALLVAAMAMAPAITANTLAGYTFDEVYDACSGAYDRNDQVAACIFNVCSEYGCE